MRYKNIERIKFFKTALISENQKQNRMQGTRADNIRPYI
jgi:hypothetical protein